MKTKIMAAGNVWPYFKSARDMMRRQREFQARLCRGEEIALRAALAAQAPAGVVDPETRPRPASRRRPRGATPWIRHCQDHQVHLISCFVEGCDVVGPKLETALPLTEGLLRLGLPETALKFGWYEHPRRAGSHAHAGMLRTLVPAGGPYSPRLSPALCEKFDRLLSRHLGVADPLAPEGLRPLYLAWGSAKAENEPELQDICVALAELCRPAKTGPPPPARLVDWLREKQYVVLVEPDDEGSPQLTAEAQQFPGTAALALYPHTVVIRSRDAQRVLYLKGPACRPGDWLGAYRSLIEERRAQVAALVDVAGARQYYEEFLQLTEQRFVEQAALVPGPFARVEPSAFAALQPEESPAAAFHDSEFIAAGVAALPPLLAFTDRIFPFADAPQGAPAADLTDLAFGDLAEMHEAELWIALTEPAPEMEPVEEVTPATAGPASVPAPPPRESTEDNGPTGVPVPGQPTSGIQAATPVSEQPPAPSLRSRISWRPSSLFLKQWQRWREGQDAKPKRPGESDAAPENPTHP